MNLLARNQTGNISEARVKQKLESFGLIVRKPVPDIGIDFEVYHPDDPGRIAKIQVKGRNPKIIKTYRWFQLRVSKNQLELARREGIPADETWKKKVRMVDFFILDAVVLDELWVFTQEQTFKLISLNEHHHGKRPDNVFEYEERIKLKQKEMDLEAPVPEISIMEQFESCKNNFSSILDFLGVESLEN